MSLENNVALVTGSSRGIGKIIALRLAEADASLVVNYKSDSWTANEVVKSIKKIKRQAIAIQCDVSNFADVEEMVGKVTSEFGRIDILVNNVGPFLYKSIYDTTIQEWHQIINSNLNSTFYCCKAVVPIMRKQKSGNIINIGAPNAERTQGYVQNCPYAIAKTGVVVLSKSLAKEEAKNGIRVNVINPGFIQTDEYTEEMKKDMPKQVPLGRLGKPEDIANAVLFLVSDEANYITGSVLNVHGGLWC
ncbi:MAG: 3-oxoacyl-ACP reductase FabG [candidate division Zixibacteria bacterium]|nr:3-oxoacyl-ACP reductase FabG [candidate division Zixibacteria bacterium]